MIGLVLLVSLVSLSCNAEEGDSSSVSDAKYDLSAYTAQQAYEAGKLMRAQFKDSLARPYLKYAADKGNVNAAYLYGMDITSKNPNSETPEMAKKYLIQAANQGQLDATYYLYKYGTWFRNATRLKYRSLYHDGAITLAETKPGKASYDLYVYYKELNSKQATYYLKKSQEYSYSPAILLASIYSYNEQTNPEIKTRSIKTVEKIAKKGFMPAIRACINYYEKRKEFDKALDWKKVALKNGDIMSLASLAKIYAGLMPNYTFEKTDLIKSYAYLSVYLDNAGKNRFSYLYTMMENVYTDIADKMTKEQKKKANDLIANYKGKVVFYSYDTLWDI